jgi:ribosomal protein S27E
VGGKETGQQMQHYVIPGGRFANAFAALAATGWKLNLESAHRPGEQRGPSSKTKFTCSGCGQNCWGKPDLMVRCDPCGALMIAQATR